DEDDVRPERVELARDRVARARAERGDHDHRRHADEDPEHGERRAHHVAADGPQGQPDRHQCTTYDARDHSVLSASMGSIFAALRAGKKPKTTPMVPLVTSATASAAPLGTTRQSSA